MKMRGWWGVALVLLASTAWAAGQDAARKEVEASLLVTGTIGVDSRGEVFELAIDQPEKLPKGVVRFIEKGIGHWQFSPPLLDEQPVDVRNKMRILVVAKKQEDGNHLMRLQAVNFDPLTADR